MKARLIVKYGLLSVLIGSIVILLSCEKEEPENRDYDPEVSREAVATINPSEVGGKGLKLISSRDDDSPISNESFNTIVSKEGTQLLAINDEDDKLRALTLSIPSSEDNTVMEIDARSTSISLIFNSPGISTVDPQTAKEIINKIENLESFNPFYTYIKNNLKIESLNDFVSNPSYDSLLLNCMEEYYKDSSDATKGETKGTELWRNWVSFKQSGVKSLIELKNQGFRFVSVYERDLGPKAAELRVTNVVPNMKGAVPASWGSLFTATIANPTYKTINYTPIAKSEYSEFWVLGLGIAYTDEDIPDSLLNKNTILSLHNLCSLGYYGALPLLDLFLGTQASIDMPVEELEEIMPIVKFALSFNSLMDAKTKADERRELYNAVYAITKMLVQNPPPSYLKFAAKYSEFLRYFDALFSSVNLELFVIDLMQLEPYSRFVLLAYNQVPMFPALRAPENNATNVTLPVALLWSASTIAETYEIQVSRTNDFSSLDFHETEVTGTGKQLNNLQKGVKYYWRMRAINRFGASYWSEVWNFTTELPQTIPIVTTSAISNLTGTSATSGGNVISDGGAEVIVRGVCWSTSVNPKTTDNVTTNGAGTGSFISNISGLTTGTTFHVRAYAINSYGTSYGDDMSFKAGSLPTPPIITTTSISNITQTSIATGGNVISSGSSDVIVRGVCWSTKLNPKTTENVTTDGAGTGSFASNITGLTPGTTYHVRAYAINSAGASYGQDRSFKTLLPPSIPTVTTNSVSNIVQTSAVSGGNVTSSGNTDIIVRGICWSTSVNPKTTNSITTEGSGTGSFTSKMTGLDPEKTYHVRAYAINSAGTAYGNDRSFTTPGYPPVTAFTATPTTITVGQSVQFTDQSSNSPTSWSWSFGDGGTSTSKNPSHTYSTAGVYTVRLTATNSAGSDEEVKTNYITVNSPVVAPVAAFSGTPRTITAGQSVQFTDQSSNSPTSWSWNFGDGGTSTLKNPLHTYSTVGVYTVRLTATNSAGSDEEVKSNYITVNSSVIAPVAAFTATPTTITVGQSVQFTDQSTNSPTSWSWNFGDGGISTARNPSYTYNSVGIYTVTLTVTNNVGTDSQSIPSYITVNPLRDTFQEIIGGALYDNAQFAQQTIDGGYIVSGLTFSYGSGNGDIYLINLDQNGNVIWEKPFNITNAEDNGQSVFQTDDNGFVILVRDNSSISDTWIIKTDNDGNKLWTKFHDFNPYSMEPTNDEGFIIAGSYHQNLIKHIAILKINFDGAKVWMKTYPVTDWSAAQHAIQTIDGGYIIAAWSKVGDYLYSNIIKTDSQGETEWEKQFSYGAYRILQTKDGGYIVLRNDFSSSYFRLIKLDQDGNPIWEKSYGGPNGEGANSIQQTSDNGFIITGYTESFGAGSKDVYLIKTNEQGEEIWYRTYGGGDSDEGKNVILTRDGGYMIVGNTKNSETGNVNAFIIKTDLNGNVDK